MVARLHTGWGVIGDNQHLPGYSLLLYEDPRIDADDRSARAEDQPVNEIAVNAVSELFI